MVKAPMLAGDRTPGEFLGRWLQLLEIAGHFECLTKKKKKRQKDHMENGARENQQHNLHAGFLSARCIQSPVRSGASLVLQQHRELLLITLVLVEECSGVESR